MERAPGDTRVGYDTSRPVGSFFAVAREVLLRPADFFSRLRSSEEGVDFTTSGPTWRQIAFTVACLYVNALLSVLFSGFDPLLGESAVSVSSISSILRRDPAFLLTLAAIFVFVWPLVGIFSLYVGSFFQQLFVRLFIGRENRSYWATFPVVAYASALSLIDWIPILGYLLSLYAIYITLCGLRAMHDTTTRKALPAAISPPLIVFAFGVIPYLQAL